MRGGNLPLVFYWRNDVLCDDFFLVSLPSMGSPRISRSRICSCLAWTSLMVGLFAKRLIISYLRRRNAHDMEALVNVRRKASKMNNRKNIFGCVCVESNVIENIINF